MTGYSAVVTTTLMSQKNIAISSFQEGIEKGYTFCVYPQIVDVVVAAYPKAGPLLVGTGGSQLLDAMDRGECKAAILFENHWAKMRMFGNTEHCDASPKARLPDVVHVMANHIPVRPELVQAMSTFITLEGEMGTFGMLADKAKFNYTSAVCAEPSATGEVQQFGVDSLGAPLMFLLVVGLVSLLITRLGRRIEKRTEQIKAKIDTNQDGHVSRQEIAVAADLAVSQLMAQSSSARVALRRSTSRQSNSGSRQSNSVEVSSVTVSSSGPGIGDD